MESRSRRLLFTLVLMLCTLTCALPKASADIRISDKKWLVASDKDWASGVGRLSQFGPKLTVYSHRKNKNMQVFVDQDFMVKTTAGKKFPADCKFLLDPVKAKKNKDDYCTFTRSYKTEKTSDSVRTYLSVKTTPKKSILEVRTVTVVISGKGRAPASDELDSLIVRGASK